MGSRLAHTAFFEKQHTGWGAQLAPSLGRVNLAPGDVEFEPIMGIQTT